MISMIFQLQINTIIKTNIKIIKINASTVDNVGAFILIRGVKNLNRVVKKSYKPLAQSKKRCYKSNINCHNMAMYKEKNNEERMESTGI